LRLRKYSNVMWIAVAACILTVGWYVLCCFGWYGISTMFGLVDEKGFYTKGNDEHSHLEGWGTTAVFFVVVLFLFWGTLFISYAVHAICAGIMGTWYFGTSRKRTTMDAFIRTFTTSLGSISFASFIVAVVRAMETLASSFEQKAAKDGNAGLMLLACCIKCILSCIGDILQYLNGLAIVRVAVYGESYWTAAKRTMNMMKYRGMDVLINDDLSGLVVWLGCFICFLITIPCMFGYYYLTGANIANFDDTTGQGFMALAFAVCALLIPIQILTTIQSFVQSLFVLWADDPQALDETHPHESRMLKNAAYGYNGYQVKYDDKYIITQGARYA